jgi:tetratricopeptide (TPR) repeat protein
MTGAGLRSAQAAIDGVRAVVERLDEGRHPEENAADLLEAWEGVQAALRSLTGAPALAGQSVIREARQRNLLSLDEAHALVDFSAAAERSHDAGYRPNAGDLVAARGAYHLFEAALARTEAPAAGPPPQPSAAPPAAETEVSPLPEPRARTSNVLARVIVLVALLAVVGVAGYYAVQYRSRVGHLRRGTAAYLAGDRSTAKRELAAAAAANPKAAIPHVYLARIAREEGDPLTASRELTTALNLEPENALALREMGAHLLALGNLDLARRFYVRAVQADPADKPALGYLACTLARLGRFDEAQRFLQRAGPGEWSACVSAVVPPPGAPSPVGVPK